MMNVELIETKLENYKFDIYGEKYGMDKILKDLKLDTYKYTNTLGDSLEYTFIANNDNSFLGLFPQAEKDEPLLLHKEILSFYLKKEISKFITAYHFVYRRKRNSFTSKKQTPFYGVNQKLFESVYDSLEEGCNGRINSIVYNDSKNNITFNFTFFDENRDAYENYRIRLIKLNEIIYQIYVSCTDCETDVIESSYFSRVTLSLNISSLSEIYNQLCKSDIEYIIAETTYMMYKNKPEEFNDNTSGVLTMLDLIHNPENIRILEFSRLDNEQEDSFEAVFKYKMINKAKPPYLTCEKILSDFLFFIFTDICEKVSIGNRSFKECFEFKNALKKCAVEMFNKLISKYTTAYGVFSQNLIPDMFFNINIPEENAVLLVNIFRGNLRAFDISISILETDVNCEKFYYQDKIITEIRAITNKNITEFKEKVLRYSDFDTSVDVNSEILKTNYTVFKYLEEKYLYNNSQN